MTITRVAAICFPLVVACALRADAGLCAIGRVEFMADAQEARAKAAQPPPGNHGDDICFDQDMADAPLVAPKLTARLLAACTTIMDKRADDDLCPMIAAYLGQDHLGAHDVVAAIAARPNRIADKRANEMFLHAGSPRAEALVIARWTELEPVADAKPDDRDLQNDWAAWRVRGALALGAVGGDAAKQFLTAELAKKIDLGVKNVARDAIRRIEVKQRALATPTSPTQTTP